MRIARIAAIAVLALLAQLGVASAQDWPTRPVTFVVPYAAGGPVDTLARILAARLGDILGQQVVVENVGGAGGMTGSNRVAKAEPNGYTMLMGGSAVLAQNQSLYKRPLYNAATDFAPVTLFADSARVLITRKDLPVGTLPEFIAYAKANQAKLQFGSAGAGSATHIACVMLNMAMGVNVTHVPYRGTAPAMQDIIGGRIDYICDVISTSLPLVRANSVKALALLSPSRSPVIPELATAHEQGLKDFDVDGWNAFFFPKDTPDPVVRRLAQATSDILDAPAVRDAVRAALGAEEFGAVYERGRSRPRDDALALAASAVANPVAAG